MAAGTCFFNLRGPLPSLQRLESAYELARSCEADAIFGEVVQSRGLDWRVAMAVDMVGPEGVNGHQENIGAGCRFLSALGADAGGPCHGRADQQANSFHAPETNME